jgi:hypothetical protein
MTVSTDAVPLGAMSEPEGGAMCPECAAVIVDLEHHRHWHLWLRRRLGTINVPNPEHPEYQDPRW